MTESTEEVREEIKPKVYASELKRWGADSKAEKEEESSGKKSKKSEVKLRFPYRPELNQHLAVYNGEFTTIDTDALVCPTGERFDHVGGPHEILRNCGGEEYAKAIVAMGHCRMSEVKLSKGFGICARNVIHTVGPRFNAKYTTAAVNALNKCYLNSLQASVDNGFKTLVFLPLHSDEKNYPVLSGAAIACRTLRRFLEHHPDKIDCIVLLLQDPKYYDAYMEILPQYMPRSHAEAVEAESKLPKDVGNEWGEDAVEERSIRICVLPGMNADDFDEEEYEDEAPTVISDETTPLEISQKVASPDVRVLAAANDPTSADYIPQIYLQFLEQASSEDLSALEKAKFVYVSGMDMNKRKLVVFNSQAYSQPSVVKSQVLPYMAKLLDSVSHSPYTIIYFHSPLANSADSMTWLHDLAATFPKRYLTNLNIAVVYGTFWLRMHLRINRLADLWDVQDISYYDDLRELFTSVPGTETIKIPQEYIDSDKSIIVTSTKVDSGVSDFQNGTYQSPDGL